MKRVKFTGFGSNSAIGGFGPGDIATVSDELAKHFVDEAKVAVYAQLQQSASVEAAKEGQKSAGRAGKRATA